MLLKLRRSQREGGVLSKNVLFCLDARAEFSPEEQRSITRYKLQNQVIYNSEASKAYLDRSDAHRDGSLKGNLRSLGLAAMAATKLNITIAGLQRGQHIECKSLDELLGAEQAIMTACENLTGYLETAATFDGREVLFDFAAGAADVVAQAPGLAPPVGTGLSSPPPAARLPAPIIQAAEEPNGEPLEPDVTKAPAYIPPPAPIRNSGGRRMSDEQQLAFVAALVLFLLVFFWALGRAH